MRFSFASKSFGKNRVLDAISLELNSGSITVLMGASGSGKTTFLRMMANLDHDDEGTLQAAYRVGMVFQEPQLLAWKTIAENIALGGPDHGFLEALGLESSAHLFPRQISLGMARRTAFARAVASDPELLILDEPFASLDREWVEILRKKILSVSQERKIPIILTTHQVDDARALNADLVRLEGSPARLI